jgi:hypothetical protein
MSTAIAARQPDAELGQLGHVFRRQEPVCVHGGRPAGSTASSSSAAPAGRSAPCCRTSADAAPLGLASGQGLAAIVAMLIANLGDTVAEFAGIGAALSLFGVPIP